MAETVGDAISVPFWEANCFPTDFSTGRAPTVQVIFRLSSSCASWHPAHSRLKNYLQLNLNLLYWVFVAPFTGQFFSISQIFRQMVFIGVRATSMVALTAFSIGVTLAMQAAHSLQQMGAEIYVPDLVMLSILREMGPVLIAVIVIGRSGSAVAAELGTMKVSEEIEALEVMAINPVQYLVVPRFLAMLIMLPALTIFGNYIGVLGGWAVCRFALNFNTAGYIMRALESADTWDLYSGMIKSVVFAWIVITIACNAGLHVEGGAEGVGQATTSSVVQALLAMLVSNAILTGIFFFGS
jgi:phospholipid/cholesterol/gamma-HCH transport system permease protein